MHWKQVDRFQRYKWHTLILVCCTDRFQEDIKHMPLNYLNWIDKYLDNKWNRWLNCCLIDSFQVDIQYTRLLLGMLNKYHLDTLNRSLYSNNRIPLSMHYNWFDWLMVAHIQVNTQYIVWNSHNVYPHYTIHKEHW